MDARSTVAAARLVLAIAASAAAGLGLLVALLVVVPAPTPDALLLGIRVAGRSLHLTVAALLGVAVAAVLRRMGCRLGALAVGGLTVATLVLSLVPLGAALRASAEQDVPLSLAEYLAEPPVPEGGLTETARYRDVEGGLFLDVWRPGGEPASGSLRSAVLLVHGGAWAAGSRGDNASWVRWLTDRGHVVVDLDYRLAPPPRWRDAPEDVSCALGWVRQHAARLGVDPERIALLGMSAGGHLALLAAYTAREAAPPPGCPVPPTGVAAVAALYPVTDPAAIAGAPHPGFASVVGTPALPTFVGGSPDALPDRYRTVSPLHWLDGRDPPTLLIHGGSDQVVPVEQSLRLGRALDSAAVPHRVVALPGVNHSYDLIWGSWPTQLTRHALGQFLDERLGPDAR